MKDALQKENATPVESGSCELCLTDLELMEELMDEEMEACVGGASISEQTSILPSFTIAMVPIVTWLARSAMNGSFAAKFGGPRRGDPVKTGGGGNE
jgi:hypothetical protein